MRVLVLLAIGLLLYVIISKALKRQAPQRPQAGKDINTLVPCAQCGINILLREAIASTNSVKVQYYCCVAHREVSSKQK